MKTKRKTYNSGTVGINGATLTATSKSYDYNEGEKSIEMEEPLEINYDKAREVMGDDKWQELIKTATEHWIEGNNYDKGRIDLLKHEGILATKREKNLNDLLEED